MNAPTSMMSESVPPAMVADNYCFVVDGDKVRMGDIRKIFIEVTCLLVSRKVYANTVRLQQ